MDLNTLITEIVSAYLSIKLPLYMLRWQLSTLTLGPAISWRAWRKEKKTNPNAKWKVFDKEALITAFWGNIIGSLIFFAVDIAIIASK
jgi:hypothetical protein